MFYHAHTHTKISYNSLFSKWLNASTCAIIESFFFSPGMAQRFKPCFLKTMAIAFQNIQRQKGDYCERGEKLETKLRSEIPCGSGLFETWIIPFG